MPIIPLERVVFTPGRGHATQWRMVANRVHPLFVVAAAMVFAGCASSAVGVKYSLFGPMDRATEKRVVADFKKTKPGEPTEQVVVYQQAFPEGVSYVDGVLKIAEGAPYRAIGQFKLTSGLVIPSSETMIANMKRLAVAAGGNMVVCSLTYKADYDLVREAVGVILEYTGTDGAVPPAAPPTSA